jgi:hypothetical protein
MKKLALSAALAGSLALTGCATQPYGHDPYYSSPYGHHQQTDQAGRVATGAAIGGAAGAIGGAIIPGVSTVEGAIAGAILGGVARGRDQGSPILSRYPRLLLLRRPVRTTALRL